MGLSTSFQSLVRGKVADTIYYLVRDNASGTIQQGRRRYQAAVFNPKTYKQAVQRIRLKPLQDFYALAKPILQRSFESVKYGEASHQKFLSLNMSDFNGPYLEKGSLLLAPGPFILSRGSLGSIEAMFDPSAMLLTLFQTSMLLSSSSPGLTQGAYFASLLAADAMIKEGDQLTFVYVYQPIVSSYSEAPIMVGADSFIVDPNDNTPNINFNAHSVGALKYLDFFPKVNGSNVNIYAAAVILSRRSSSGQHLRSNSRLTCSNLSKRYLTEDAFNRAVMSYMTEGSISDTWPTDPNIPNDDIRAAFTLIAEKSWFTNPWSGDDPGPEVFGFVNSNGVQGLFYVLYDDDNEVEHYVPCDRFGHEVTLDNAGTPYHLYIDKTAVLFRPYSDFVNGL